MAKETALKRKRLFSIRRLRANWELLLLCLPAVAGYIIFHYVPMVGLVMPFINYKFNLGLFGSPWVGFKNFRFLFMTQDLWRITRNTVGYNIIFLIVGTVVNVGIALLLFEIREKRGSLKTYQTIMTFPNFMSWVIVGYITYAIFNPRLGILNQMIRTLGGQDVDVYSSPQYWPFILPIVNAWKGAGMGSMMYLASLLSIDGALYEAATIDGASRWQQTRYITLPSLSNTIVLLTVLALGNVLNAGFDQIFNMYNPLVYSTSDIIDTWVYRIGLTKMQFSLATAAGLFKSLVSFVLITVSYLFAYKFADYTIF